MANPVVSLKQLLHRHEYRICAQQISSSSRVRWHLGHDEGITLDLVLGADSLQPSTFSLQPSAFSHQPSAFSFQHPSRAWALCIEPETCVGAGATVLIVIDPGGKLWSTPALRLCARLSACPRLAPYIGSWR